MHALRWLIASAALLHGAVAFADLWAYVDSEGHSHVANRQVDVRYKLFFKGRTTLDVPDAPAAALAGTALHERATNAARAERFASLIDTSAGANGIDAALVKALIAVESGFDPRAVSNKGAVGLMQVLPDTGERYGITADARRSVADKLLDPATNLRIGTRYLRDLLARYADDVSLALAAYNAGEGTVASHDNTVPPFAETRDYVKLVRQVYALYRPAPAATATPVRIIGRTRHRDER
jgi:soluble lytic murein transglycosylase-like protein